MLITEEGRPVELGSAVGIGPPVELACPVEMGRPVELGAPGELGAPDELGTPDKLGMPDKLGIADELAIPLELGITEPSGPMVRVMVGTDTEIVEYGIELDGVFEPEGLIEGTEMGIDLEGPTAGDELGIAMLLLGRPLGNPELLGTVPAEERV